MTPNRVRRPQKESCRGWRALVALERVVGNPEVDFGIEGNFDYVVDLSGLGNRRRSSGDEGEGRSVLQAFQEDMELKLEPRKWPVDVLVIDSVNKVPSKNY